MRQSTKSSSTKRGTSSSSSSKKSGSGRASSGSTAARGSSRSGSSREGVRDEDDRYGALGTRMSSSDDSRDYRDDDQYMSGRGSYGGEYGRGEGYGRSYGRGTSEDYSRGEGSRNQNSRSDYGREGVRTISGRYSDFEDYGGSSRQGQYNNESERGFARGGRRGEYSSVNDQDFYEGNTGRSPWRDTYDTERNNSSRGSSRSQNYSGQGRGYSEFDYDDDRMNSRGSRYGSSHGYNEDQDSGRQARYGSYRDRNDRWMNNYDNQDENVDDEYGFRERYNENRY